MCGWECFYSYNCQQQHSNKKHNKQRAKGLFSFNPSRVHVTTCGISLTLSSSKTHKRLKRLWFIMTKHNLYVAFCNKTQACFVGINSILLNLLCVWILFQNTRSYSCFKFSSLLLSSSKPNPELRQPTIPTRDTFHRQNSTALEKRTDLYDKT